jgi:hypothetical protein
MISNAYIHSLAHMKTELICFVLETEKMCSTLYCLKMLVFHFILSALQVCLLHPREVYPRQGR